jgi:hypothetical protein
MKFISLAITPASSNAKSFEAYCRGSSRLFAGQLSKSKEPSGRLITEKDIHSTPEDEQAPERLTVMALSTSISASSLRMRLGQVLRRQAQAISGRRKSQPWQTASYAAAVEARLGENVAASGVSRGLGRPPKTLHPK